MAQPISATISWQILDRDLRAVARDRLELVERATRVAQATPRDHRHIGPRTPPAQGRAGSETQSPPTPHRWNACREPGRRDPISTRRPRSAIAFVSCTRPSRPRPRVQTAIGKGTCLTVGHLAGGETLGETRTAPASVGRSPSRSLARMPRAVTVMAPPARRGPCDPRRNGRATARPRCSAGSVHRRWPIVTGTPSPANSASFWRQPPQGGTGGGAIRDHGNLHDFAVAGSDHRGDRTRLGAGAFGVGHVLDVCSPDGSRRLRSGSRPPPESRNKGA